LNLTVWVSTFSIDVDTASYSFVRASLTRNVLPQPAAVRTEEMVNYFHYDYAPPRTTAQPFSTNVAVFPSPWVQGRKLVRIGIKGYALTHATRPRANLGSVDARARPTRSAGRSPAARARSTPTTATRSPGQQPD